MVISLDSNVPDEQITQLWTQVTNEKKFGRIHTAGISDFDFEKLKKLKPKPDFDQISPSQCDGFCGISPELMEYAKSNDIKLKTHGDPPCNPRSMAVDLFGIFAEKFGGREKHIVTARYSQTSKDRMALTKRGFFHLTRINYG